MPLPNAAAKGLRPMGGPTLPASVGAFLQLRAANRDASPCGSSGATGGSAHTTAVLSPLLSDWSSHDPPPAVEGVTNDAQPPPLPILPPPQQNQIQKQKLPAVSPRQRKPRGVPKRMPRLQCQVDGCFRNLARAKEYFQRRRCCAYHSKQPQVQIEGVTLRWCQLCCCFHDPSAFDGIRRSCRERLVYHNQRRRAREQANAAAGLECIREPPGRVAQPAAAAAIPANAQPVPEPPRRAVQRAAAAAAVCGDQQPVLRAPGRAARPAAAAADTVCVEPQLGHVKRSRYAAHQAATAVAACTGAASHGQALAASPAAAAAAAAAAADQRHDNGDRGRRQLQPASPAAPSAVTPLALLPARKPRQPASVDATVCRGIEWLEEMKQMQSKAQQMLQQQPPQQQPQPPQLRAPPLLRPHRPAKKGKHASAAAESQSEARQPAPVTGADAASTFDAASGGDADARVRLENSLALLRAAAELRPAKPSSAIKTSDLALAPAPADVGLLRVGEAVVPAAAAAERQPATASEALMATGGGGPPAVAQPPAAVTDSQAAADGLLAALCAEASMSALAPAPTPPAAAAAAAAAPESMAEWRRQRQIREIMDILRPLQSALPEQAAVVIQRQPEAQPAWDVQRQHLATTRPSLGAASLAAAAADRAKAAAAAAAASPSQPSSTARRVQLPRTEAEALGSLLSLNASTEMTAPHHTLAPSATAAQPAAAALPLALPLQQVAARATEVAPPPPPAAWGRKRPRHECHKPQAGAEGSQRDAVPPHAPAKRRRPAPPPPASPSRPLPRPAGPAAPAVGSRQPPREPSQPPSPPQQHGAASACALPQASLPPGPAAAEAVARVRPLRGRDWAALLSASCIALPLQHLLDGVAWQPEATAGEPLWWARRIGSLLLLVAAPCPAAVPAGLAAALMALAEVSLRLASGDTGICA